MRLYEFAWPSQHSARQPVMPDDHSKVAPLLPIPNRTVKRLCADDSADSRVKVGHRQALTTKPPTNRLGVCLSDHERFRKFVLQACEDSLVCAIMRGSADRGGARRPDRKIGLAQKVR